MPDITSRLRFIGQNETAKVFQEIQSSQEKMREDARRTHEKVRESFGGMGNAARELGSQIGKTFSVVALEEFVRRSITDGAKLESQQRRMAMAYSANTDQVHRWETELQSLHNETLQTFEDLQAGAQTWMQVTGKGFDEMLKSFPDVAREVRLTGASFEQVSTIWKGLVEKLNIPPSQVGQMFSVLNKIPNAISTGSDEIDNMMDQFKALGVTGPRALYGLVAVLQQTTGKFGSVKDGIKAVHKVLSDSIGQQDILTAMKPGELENVDQLFNRISTNIAHSTNNFDTKSAEYRDLVTRYGVETMNFFKNYYEAIGESKKRVEGLTATQDVLYQQVKKESQSAAASVDQITAAWDNAKHGFWDFAKEIKVPEGLNLIANIMNAFKAKDVVLNKPGFFGIPRLIYRYSKEHRSEGPGAIVGHPTDPDEQEKARQQLEELGPAPPPATPQQQLEERMEHLRQQNKRMLEKQSALGGRQYAGDFLSDASASTPVSQWTADAAQPGPAERDKFGAEIGTAAGKTLAEILEMRGLFGGGVGALATGAGAVGGAAGGLGGGGGVGGPGGLPGGPGAGPGAGPGSGPIAAGAGAVGGAAGGFGSGPGTGPIATGAGGVAGAAGGAAPGSRPSRGGNAKLADERGTPIDPDTMKQAETLGRAGDVPGLQKLFAAKGYRMSGPACGIVASQYAKSAGFQPPGGFAVASNWHKFGESMKPEDINKPGHPFGSMFGTYNSRRYGGNIGAPLPTGATGGHVMSIVPGTYNPKTGQVDVVDQYGYSHGKRDIKDMDLRFAGADAVAAAEARRGQEAKSAGGASDKVSGGRYPTEAELSDKSTPAGERFNNPFNMWHDKYAEQQGGLPGRQITQFDTPAIFPSKQAGAAAAIRKMAESPKYSGKTMEDLIGTWVGHGESYAPIISKMTGLPTNTRITPEFLKSEDGLKFLKAMARYETRVQRPYPLSDEQWRSARDTAMHTGPAAAPDTGNASSVTPEQIARSRAIVDGSADGGTATQRHRRAMAGTTEARLAKAYPQVPPFEDRRNDDPANLIPQDENDPRWQAARQDYWKARKAREAKEREEMPGHMADPMSQSLGIGDIGNEEKMDRQREWSDKNEYEDNPAILNAPLNRTRKDSAPDDDGTDAIRDRHRALRSELEKPIRPKIDNSEMVQNFRRPSWRDPINSNARDASYNSHSDLGTA